MDLIKAAVQYWWMWIVPILCIFLARLDIDFSSGYLMIIVWIALAFSLISSLVSWKWKKLNKLAQKIRLRGSEQPWFTGYLIALIILSTLLNLTDPLIFCLGTLNIGVWAMRWRAIFEETRKQNEL